MSNDFFLLVEPLADKATHGLNGCYCFYAVNRNGYNRNGGGYGTLTLTVAFSTPSTLYTAFGAKRFNNALEMKAYVKRNLSRLYSRAVADYLKRKKAGLV